jgi:non-heme chloroperoxidase
VVFSHGWPLSSDAFEDQMFFLASNGYRCVANDRRGHGRSGQSWDGNDLTTYADDLAELVEALGLQDAVHVGHSTGGGVVTRYIGRHGTSRVAKAVLIGAIPPLMLKTETNPGGLPLETFDQLRANVLADRTQFWKDLSLPFYGYNRPGAKVSEGVREQFVMQCMMAGFPASYLGIKAWSETDLTEDLKKIDVPALVIHGDDDQIVPIATRPCGPRESSPDATLKIYEGRAPRLGHDPQGPAQPRPARVHQGVNGALSRFLSPTSVLPPLELRGKAMTREHRPRFTRRGFCIGLSAFAATGEAGGGLHRLSW